MRVTNAIVINRTVSETRIFLQRKMSLNDSSESGFLVRNARAEGPASVVSVGFLSGIGVLFLLSSGVLVLISFGVSTVGVVDSVVSGMVEEPSDIVTEFEVRQIYQPIGIDPNSYLIGSRRIRGLHCGT
jgi:hypothetical protein